MTDILMLPFDYMTAQVHAKAAHMTGRSYCVAPNFEVAQKHLDTYGQPKLLVADFAVTDTIADLPASYVELTRLRQVPAIHIFSGGLEGAYVDDKFNFIATISSPQQYDSILPDLMNAFFEQITDMQGIPVTAETFKACRDKVSSRPSRELSLARRNEFPLVKLG